MSTVASARPVRIGVQLQPQHAGYPARGGGAPPAPVFGVDKTNKNDHI
jgi:hypothetical protein